MPLAYLRALWPSADRIFAVLLIVIAAARTEPRSVMSFVPLAFSVLVAFMVFKAPRLRRALPSATGVLGIGMSFLALPFFQFPDEQILSQVNFVVTISVIFYLGFMAWGYGTIRNSFAIIPSCRPLVKSGPYNLIRNPIYSSYFHFAACYTVILPTWRNVIVTAILGGGLLLRTLSEEALLAEDTAYGDYRARVKARFFSIPLSSPLMLSAAATIIGKY